MQASDPRPDSNRSAASEPRSARTLLLSVGLGLFTFLALYEWSLHLWPERLPLWYRLHFTGGGIELDQPGFLAELPLEGSPPRWFAEDYTGPPAGDLTKGRALVDGTDNPDAERYPPFHWRVDEDGFPNPEVLRRADVLFSGDSFGNAAAVLSPPGLQVGLAAASGRSIYNLSQPGIGPQQQAWMLEQYGLSKQPSAVIWFFFDGNDLAEATVLALAKSAGYETWAELPRYREPPAVYLPGMLSLWFKQSWKRSVGKPFLPGLAFTLADGTRLPIWFSPDHLLTMSRSLEWWQALPGLAANQDAVRSARAAAVAAGARFLVLFVPCKSHVLVPLVEPDEELLYSMAGFWDKQLDETDPRAFRESLLRNRGAQEELMRSFCEREGIEFLSAVPYLEALARSGVPGYLSADTHWTPAGQRVLIEPLREWLAAGSE